MKGEHTRPDLLWKELFTEFHMEAMLFFFGKKLFNAIDWSIPPDFLEQEFSDVFTDNDPSKIITDKIMRYRLKNGQDKIIIVHTEFQGKFEKGFVKRMFWYFVYIAAKYKTTDITALVIYTHKAKPKEYNTFKVVNFGTELTYKFNSYVIREQDEAQLIASDNPFAIAVLAAFYLTEAGTDSLKRYEYKKKLVEIAAKKNFDRKKLSRLLIFVKRLILLPKNLADAYNNFVSQPKIEQTMKVTKEDLSIFTTAVAEIQEESRTEGRTEGLIEGLTTTVMNLRQEMGLSSEQIANITGTTVAFVQSIIEKIEQ